MKPRKYFLNLLADPLTAQRTKTAQHRQIKYDAVKRNIAETEQYIDCSLLNVYYCTTSLHSANLVLPDDRVNGAAVTTIITQTATR